MYEVLPYVLKFERYSRVKKMHHFRQILRLIKYSGCHFSSHMMKSILPGAELLTDQDGASYSSIG